MRGYRKLLFLLLVPLLGCRPPDSADVVRRLVAAHAELQDYQGRAEIQGPDGSTLQVAFKFLRPGYHLTRVNAPEILAGQTTLFDGQRAWFWDPHRGAATAYEGLGLPEGGTPDGFAQAVASLQAAGRVRLAGVERIAGVSLYGLEWEEGGGRRRLWVAADAWLPSRLEAEQADGSRWQVVYRELRTNTGLTPEDFRLDLPPAARLVAGVAGARPITEEQAAGILGTAPGVPVRLPPGMALTGVFQAGTTVVLLYGREAAGPGARAISLAQRRHEGEELAAPVEMARAGERVVAILQAGESTVLRWIERGLEFTLLGEAAREELLDMAASLDFPER